MTTTISQLSTNTAFSVSPFQLDIPENNKFVFDELVLRRMDYDMFQFIEYIMTRRGTLNFREAKICKRRKLSIAYMFGDVWSVIRFTKNRRCVRLLQFAPTYTRSYVIYWNELTHLYEREFISTYIPFDETKYVTM